MKIALKTNKNYLLSVGAYLVLGSLLFIAFYLLLGAETGRETSHNTLLDNVLLCAVLAITVGPVTEEIGFRGVFSNNRVFTYLSYVLFPVVLFFSGNYYLITLYPAVHILVMRKNMKLAYFVSSTLFSLAHFRLQELVHFYSVLLFINHLGFGYILIWVTLNYGLKKSVLAHAAFNALVFLPMLYLFQYPDPRIARIVESSYEFSWKRVPLLNLETPGKNLPEKPAPRKITVKEFSGSWLLEPEGIKSSKETDYYKFDIKVHQEDSAVEFSDSESARRLLIKSNF